MKVRFIARMPKTGYSGGRLAALTYANSLALIEGVVVEFFTDHKSIMEDDFKTYSRVKYFHTTLDNLALFQSDEVDVVVLVPSLGDFAFHVEVVKHSLELNSKLVLLNFETPNWFNQHVVTKREVKLWDGWVYASMHADLILSLSREGMTYAKCFYTSLKKHTSHTYCYVSVNSPCADRVPEMERTREILMISRLDSHKGIHALEYLADESLKGYTFRLILGNGNLENNLEESLRNRFGKAGVTLNIERAISVSSKFSMIKQVSTTYFPTLFEGFGIPPLESNYCNTPVACSDLKVIREYGDGIFNFFDPFSKSSALEAVHRSINQVQTPLNARASETLKRNSDIIKGGRKLLDILEQL